MTDQVEQGQEQKPATKRQARLSLYRALAWLVEDWREKQARGEAWMRITEIFDGVYVDGQASQGYRSNLTPEQVASLIEMDLSEVDGLQPARRNARRFTTRRGLLRTTNLHDFLREF